jgi:O-antigen/teichoic acid export membrane protein
LLKASGKTVATTVAIAAVGFVSSVITARILGPEGRGLLAAALLIATVAAGVSQFGLANSFIYHRGAGRRFGYWRLLAVSVSWVCGAAVLLAVVGLQMSGDARVRDELLMVACLAGFMAVQTYFMTMSQLEADLVFFNVMRFGLVFGFLAALLIVLAVLETIDYQTILLTQLLVVAVLAFPGLFWVSKVLAQGGAPGGDRATRWRDVLGYGLSYHGTVVLGIVLMNFDKIVLLKMGTMMQFGLYTLAFATSRFIGALQAAVSTALYARFAGREVEQLTHAVKAAFRLTFLPMLAAALLCAAASPWLIVAIFGDAFASMAVPFQILLFESVVGSASWMLAQRFHAAGRPGMVFVRQIISVLPIFLALPFLPQQNVDLYLSALMLIGALLRLTVTLGLYPLVLKETTPGIIPTADDIRTLRALLSGGNAA